MAISKGKTFTANEQVTNAKLHQLVDDATIDAGAVGSSQLASGAVTNAKVSDTAGIALSKIATTFGALVGGGASNVSEEVTVGSTLSLTSSELNIAATGITSGYLADGAVVADKLYSTLDLSSKTLTLPSGAVSASNLDQDFINDVSDASIAAADYIVFGDFSAAGVLKRATLNEILALGKLTASSTASVTGYGQILSEAHGLGSTPTRLRCVLVCTDAGGDAGYAQSDEIDINGVATDNQEAICTYGADDTYVFASFGNNAASGGADVRHKTSTTDTSITRSKWALKMYYGL